MLIEEGNKEKIPKSPLCYMKVYKIDAMMSSASCSSLSFALALALLYNFSMYFCDQQLKLNVI